MSGKHAKIPITLEINMTMIQQNLQRAVNRAVGSAMSETERSISYNVSNIVQSEINKGLRKLISNAVKGHPAWQLLNKGDSKK